MVLVRYATSERAENPERCLDSNETGWRINLFLFIRHFLS
jgi:hypothetical protein